MPTSSHSTFPAAVPAPKCKSWTEKDARLVYEVPFNDLLFRAQTVQSKLADAPPVDPIEFIRIIALARILMPQSHVRLTAGRTAMTDEMQALCFSPEPIRSSSAILC
jgi:biotin synthase-like enzyme